MSLSETTLSAAITETANTLQVASATGITAPNFTTGAGVTYLYVDYEMMVVTAVSGTLISVIRGIFGTRQVAHSNTQGVIAGLYSDFQNFVPSVTSFTTGVLQKYNGVAAPVAAATTITPTGQYFHITGTTATATINLPSTDFLEGTIFVIADAVWTWTTAGNIAALGTVTTAGSMVAFFWDGAKQLWYPSRVS